ncbi:hypothetical protein AJ79_07028 [Helicocarpus griseus UAMH5409]|uniref:Uncharacterized protein n=1 Tax=Helicocarpus griseus UAMH5409 TaxID=1447875 RepID=A0A2B7X790_9EURO|nr:hypothetical protein AJ79_07028 [Helicocarpus griseus UAMH5409]
MATNKRKSEGKEERRERREVWDGKRKTRENSERYGPATIPHPNNHNNNNNPSPRRAEHGTDTGTGTGTDTDITTTTTTPVYGLRSTMVTGTTQENTDKTPVYISYSTSETVYSSQQQQQQQPSKKHKQSISPRAAAAGTSSSRSGHTIHPIHRVVVNFKPRARNWRAPQQKQPSEPTHHWRYRHPSLGLWGDWREDGAASKGSLAVPVSPSHR